MFNPIIPNILLKYIYEETGNKSSCMKMYKYKKKNTRDSRDDFIFLQTLSVSSFKWENIKPSTGRVHL